MTTRVASRIPAPVAGVIVAGAGALLIWLLSFSPWRVVPIELAGQAYLLIAIVLAFRYWPPMARFVRGMAVPHRLVFGVLLGAMILGHYTLNGRSYFPFVVWAIFPKVEKGDTVTAREFFGTTASGTKVRLIPEQQFPSIVQVDRIEDFDNESHYPAGTTEHLARALAAMYNAHHAADPVRRVELVTMAVNLHPPASESRDQPSCELLKRYDISSDR